MIKEIVCCIGGTLFFAVTMKAPVNTLFYILIGSTISTVIERILADYYTTLTACFLAMLCLVFYCELVARVLKIPVTVTLMPSTIPLLPGSSIYYTMLYAISSDTEKMTAYGKTTVAAGLGIALGAIVSSILIKIFTELKKHVKCLNFK